MRLSRGLYMTWIILSTLWCIYFVITAFDTARDKYIFAYRVESELAERYCSNEPADTLAQCFDKRLAETRPEWGLYEPSILRVLTSMTWLPFAVLIAGEIVGWAVRSFRGG